jgi:elongation factor G
MKCKPILLEPYDKLVVNCPPEYLGDVLSDLSKRRGRIIATEESHDNHLDITAIVPEAEILEYTNELKSITKSTGFYNLEFDSYQEVPSAIAAKVIESMKK